MAKTQDFTYQLIELLAQNAGKELPVIDNVDDKTKRKAIQFMLENSLFFEPDSVNIRHGQMVNASPDKLYCRSSQVMKGQIKDKKWRGYPIDKDGNYEVRRIIKERTGEIVSQGDISSIKFAKISHIWGNATNPYYFTSLWNIVLIPAYCNDLMDKKSGEFAETVQSVYRAVCNKLYGADAKLGSFDSQKVKEAITPDPSSPCNDEKSISLVDWDNKNEIITVCFSDSPKESITAKLNFLKDKTSSVKAIKPNKQDVIESYNEEYLSAMSLYGDLTKRSFSNYKTYLKNAVKTLTDLRAQSGKKPKEKEYDDLSNSIAAINRVLKDLNATCKRKV